MLKLNFEIVIDIAPALGIAAAYFLMGTEELEVSL
jgi:hypothetical protein